MARNYRTLQDFGIETKTINDCYNILRIAIVQQVVRDYKRAVETLEELISKGYSNGKMIDAAKSRVTYFERWFVSEWGSLLCSDMGEQIIEFVRNEVAYGRK